MDAAKSLERTYNPMGLVTESFDEEQKLYSGESYLSLFGKSYSKDIGLNPIQSLPFSKTNFSAQAFEEDKIQPILFKEPETSYSRVKLEWEGCVDKVSDNTFTATLYNDDGDKFTAEFPKEEVSESDKNLIKENSIFYWTIGYRTTSGKQRINEEMLIFRRLPAWKSLDFDHPSDKAKEFISHFFKSTDENSATGQ